MLRSSEAEVAEASEGRADLEKRLSDVRSQKTYRV